MHACVLLAGVERALTDTSSSVTLRVEALLFLQTALACHPSATFAPHLHTLLPSLVALIDNRYYKIVAGALRVCVSSGVNVAQPLDRRHECLLRTNVAGIHHRDSATCCY